ncbi:Ras and EF-hand domain-containing protein isoform 2 [Schistosoma japonicum]|uniref:Ras and EF-hand domain-containing protein isoform 2 n=1 Tax=Schistosoma japonicum TaxID=6182 RepID=A0A4Z2DV93_SCHJA|nr:Ras and EF-hand domain-containing protein isoform 2 [Schistosoma japonicum]
MSIENLKKLLKSYDFENTGDLNKTEWIKLCSNSTINLSTDISSRLFNELDTDNDGLIKISDILYELHIWEASNQQSHSYNHFDRINNNHENELIENRNEELIYKDEDYNVLDKNQIGQQSRRSSELNIKANPVILERRKHRCSFIPSEIIIQSEGNDQWMSKKEINPDGSEVFTTTPIVKTPKYNSVCELESVLSQNYPELLSPFKTVLDDFRKELSQAKKEKINLEETYMKEKEERKSDLYRLEGELESQIQSIEERAKSEAHEKLQNEYRALVSNKEQEIGEIREQVKNLKLKIKHRTHTHCDSMNSPIIQKKIEDLVGTSSFCFTDSISSTDPLNHNYQQQNLYQNEKEDEEQNSFKRELQDVLSTLAKREAELRILKDQLAEQEVQLTMDKRELISQEEEKQNLYSQLNVMRDTVERLNKTNDYLCSALRRESIRRQNRTSPSSAFSEQSDNNETNPQPGNFSTGIPFPLEPYEFDNLESILTPQHHRNHHIDSTCRRSDYSSENVSSVSTFNYGRDKFATLENNTEGKYLTESLTPTRIFKVILVGDSGVGKSSFLYRFCDGIFYPQLRTTLGVDFRTRNILMNNSVYTIQLWDTAGQETYRCVVRSYFRKIDGVVLMYAVNQPDTFANIKYWMEMIRESTSEANVPILLVGNKVDLRNTANNSTNENNDGNNDMRQPESQKYITYEMGNNLAKVEVRVTTYEQYSCITFYVIICIH